MYIYKYIHMHLFAQSVGAVEYTYFISAEG